VLGILIGAAATRIHSPLAWWRSHLSPDVRRALAGLWPWSRTACILAWLALLPGVPLLEYFFGVNNPLVILAILFSALATLALTSVSGFARDSQYQNGSQFSAQPLNPQRVELLEETIVYPVK
jgi:hypothetical protein